MKPSAERGAWGFTIMGIIGIIMAQQLFNYILGVVLLVIGLLYFILKNRDKKAYLRGEKVNNSLYTPPRTKS